MPLNRDLYTAALILSANSPLFTNFGTLDSLGNASTSLTLPPGLPNLFRGLVAEHAYIVIDGPTLTVEHASNNVSLELQ